MQRRGEQFGLSPPRRDGHRHASAGYDGVMTETRHNRFADEMAPGAPHAYNGFWVS
jgi:hypothetical protein